jgi:hypothetical protein
MKRLLALCACAALIPAASAQDFHAQGFIEARLPVSNGDDLSWTDGGLGKARFGQDGQDFALAGALSLSWQASDSLLAVLDLQAQPQTSPELGVLSAYVRWRPVSISPWRWSVRAGAFFPPVSLENDGVGWTSRWTLTPSAINSWVGEELRDVGVEARLERRLASGSIEGGVAVFGYNDPAGELIASRGWALGDVTSVLGSRVRQPDVYSAVIFSPTPVEYKPFVENDHRPGWHADLAWRGANGWRFSLLRYDNRARPDTYSELAGREVYSWRTTFWSAGAEAPIGGVVLAAQWMDGSTGIEPEPEFYIRSHFRSAFVLAAWDRGAWRPALRYDHFQLRQDPDFGLHEDGHAWTAALNWRPRDWLRVTAEWLRIDSERPQRLAEGQAARQREDLFQLNLRYQF